ncbi:MAG: hypothetical protein ABI175_20650, partial [Polyangiales bacterium]
SDEGPRSPRPAAERLSYWSEGDARPFLSSRLDAGFGYGKAQLAVGYGKPHWIWIGAEAFAITTYEFAAFYAGIRAYLPFVDVALGVRDNYSYKFGFLEQREHHDSAEVKGTSGTHARYLAWEACLSGGLPVPGGYALWEGTVDIVTDTPPNVHLYEESIRAIMQPPKIIMARLGYLLAFGRNDFIKVGVLGEGIFLPGRDAHVLRIGPVANVNLTDHLEALGVVTFAVKSPDSLDTVLGGWAILGLRYKWATGDKLPRFP